MSQHINKKAATKNIQTYLRFLGYTGENNIPVPVDGVFDSITTQAVKNFQNSNGFTPTGTVNNDVWNSLYGKYRDKISTEVEARGLFPFPDLPKDYSITAGTRSSLVSLAQFLLDAIGTKYDGLPGPNINGVYDTNTVEAVKEFQRINLLETTGDLDKATWNRLVREYSNLEY